MQNQIDQESHVLTRKRTPLCLNFIEGGRCCAIGREGLMGANGKSAKNEEGRCELHGKFDVWVTQNDELMITDNGCPSDEPKQSLALGVNLALAEQIARTKSEELMTVVLTTKRPCLRCGSRFWMSDHDESSSGLAQTRRSYLCPSCLPIDDDIAQKLAALSYWCG
jgi:hypothetical protein